MMLRTVLQTPVIISLLLITHSTRIFAQSCYATDGSPASGFTPCNSTASQSHCCSNGEACLTSNLCYMIYDQSVNTGACTDKTWSTTKCFTQCPTSFSGSAPNTLFRCSDNNWCCSNGGSSGNTTSCCDDPNGTLFPNVVMNMPATIYNGSAWTPGFTLTSDAALSKSSSSSAPTSPSSTPNAACPTPSPIPSHKDPTKLGVSVGLGVGVPLLAALASALFLLARERRANRRMRDYVYQTTGAENAHVPWLQRVRGGKPGFRAEMSDAREVKELPGNLTAAGEPRYQELSSEGAAR